MPDSTSLEADPAAREALMLEPLTDLERGILEYLIEYLRRNTYQPSIREIGRRFQIKSTKTVSEHLQSLADKGWIERDPARSRGIRILGLELDTDTVSVPLYERTTPAADSAETPARHINLDRSLVGATRAFFIPMPDDSLVDSGIHEGDLLLVLPAAAEDFEPGDVVVNTLAGEIDVLLWPGPGAGKPHTSGDYSAREYGDDEPGSNDEDSPLRIGWGRVTAIFRRLGVPAALMAAHDDAEVVEVVDVHTPAT